MGLLAPNLRLFQYLTDKYLIELYYSMQGRCDVCGTENVDLQPKSMQGKDLNVCANCASQ
jgi:DNA-directed RNA polymerase subunit RPC12/RpoP